MPKYRVVVYIEDHEALSWRQVWSINGPAENVPEALHRASARNPIQARSLTDAAAERRKQVGGNGKATSPSGRLTQATPAGPKYPHIKVRLSGKDGNAFAVIGEVRQALRNHRVGPKMLTEFTNEATSAGRGYEGMLEVVMKWVVVT